jgi:cytochrome c oxidase subunit 2
MTDVHQSRRRTTRRVTTAGLAGLGIALAGCAEDAPQDTWAPSGPNAQMIDDLQRPVFAIAGVVGVIVCVAVAFAVWRYRDRGQDVPEQTHGKPALEIVLTVIPALILFVVGIMTYSVIFKLAETDDTEMVINVTGQQWWWEYDYPVQDEYGITQALVTSGQLVIPEDTKVLLRLTSRDVIHSFWIPKLNGKKDAVPNRIHTLRMEGSEPGMYAGQCAEFCGLSHANMRMEAIVLSRADFDAWVANQLAPYEPAEEGTLAAEGENTFRQLCATCHQVNGLDDGQGNLVIAKPNEYVLSGAAPNLSHFSTRTTFAGATWPLLNEECDARVWNTQGAEFGATYLEGVTEDCLNEKDLREWLRNAPAKKPMWADADKLESTGGLYRGMPNLALTEDQIDQLVAYLLTRK